MNRSAEALKRIIDDLEYLENALSHEEDSIDHTYERHLLQILIARAKQEKKEAHGEQLPLGLSRLV